MRAGEYAFVILRAQLFRFNEDVIRLVFLRVVRDRNQPRRQRFAIFPGRAEDFELVQRCDRIRRIDKPTPVFTKLDPSVVDEELARLEG